MATTNIFTKAKAIQRKHPKKSWQECIQMSAGKKSTVKHKRKKVGAYKVIEKGERKSTPAKKTVQVVRSKKGMFKGYKKVSGTTKRHTDTKSHNVNIRIGNVGNMYTIRDMYEKDLNNFLLQEKVYKTQGIKSTDLVMKRLRKNIQLTKQQLRNQNALISQNLK